jgi:hypothetical protein
MKLTVTEVNFYLLMEASKRKGKMPHIKKAGEFPAFKFIYFVFLTMNPVMERCG